MADAPYVLYGSHASYHTAKTRSYLRKKGIAFIERVPGHPRFRAYVRPASGNHRIPQLEAPDGTVVQDSAAIFAFLEERHPEPPGRPPGPRQQLACRLLEVLIDPELGRPAWHYRWNFMEENYGFVGREFGRSFRPTGTNEELDHYGRIIADRMEGKRAGIGATDELLPVLESITDEVLDLLEGHFVEHPYLFGGRPSIADCVLQGPLFGHLARDPVPATRMKQRAPRVFRWTEHMNAPEIALPELADVATNFAADDAVPAATRALLALCIADQAEALVATNELYAGWAAERTQLPAGTPAVEGVDEPVLGRLTTRLRGVELATGAGLYPLWLLQDVQDWLDAQPADALTACEGFAAEIGGGALLGARPVRRLTRAGSLIALG
jgi:glutathione S-transferase